MIDRERLARAICVAAGDDPEREGPFSEWWLESPYAAMARAILAHIEAQGFVIAPMEPTEAMLCAAAETPGMKAASDAMAMYQIRGYDFSDDAFADGSPLAQAYRAMR